MALNYTEIQSTLAVANHTELTLTGGADDAAIIDLSTDPYNPGVRCLSIWLQNAALTGDLTVELIGNTDADGTSGTDVLIRQATMPTANTASVVEVASELISHYVDRSAVDNIASVRWVLTGTGTDTVRVTTVDKVLQDKDSLKSLQAVTIVQ
jgi:hypothetical protein